MRNVRLPVVAEVALCVPACRREHSSGWTGCGAAAGQALEREQAIEQRVIATRQALASTPQQFDWKLCLVAAFASRGHRNHGRSPMATATSGRNPYGISCVTFSARRRP